MVHLDLREDSNVYKVDRWFEREENAHVSREKAKLNSWGVLRFHIADIYNAALNLLPSWFHNFSLLDSGTKPGKGLTEDERL